MKRKSLKELKRLLEDCNKDIKESIEIFRDIDNPQIKELYYKKLGEESIIEAVLNYINTGSTILLKVD